MNIFAEVSVLLALTVVVTMVVRLLKQPLVVGYILSGIIAGPYVLDLLHSKDELELFSKVGIVLLLFIVGLHLNPKVVKEVGAVSLVTGLGQVGFTAVIGFFLALALGIDRLAALYVSIALTFSSTIIILKLLADKKDLQKLYAKIAIGFLLVQDIVATFILIGITVVAGAGSDSLWFTLLSTVAKGLLAGVVLMGMSSLVIPRLTRYLAHSQELLFLFSLAWGMGLASLFATLGFSIEIGALVAGVTLSMTPFAEEMASRLKPLRDFFIVLFFLLLGSHMMLDSLGAVIIPAVILSIFVLVGNPIIVIVLMNWLGFNRKTGFMAGLTVAQISEFSLILASLGLRVGHLSQEVLSLVTLVGLITIAGSTYLILYSEKIYPVSLRLLQWLELFKKHKKAAGSVGENYQSVIFGYDRVGHHFARVLQKLGKEYLIVDYNPSSVERLQKEGHPFRYGDASDVEFLGELPLSKPELIISTIPDLATNLLITQEMLRRNSKAVVIPLTHTLAEAETLYQAGASYVLLPHYLGAEYGAEMIEKNQLDLEAYARARAKQKHLFTHSSQPR